jgi:hypothetical protein
MRFLIAMGAFVLGHLRRLAKRMARPGTGPFVAGC